MNEGPLFCLTLDLENDWYFDDEELDHLTFNYIDDFIDLITRLDVPLTIFVVGKTLTKYPEEIDLLQKTLDCEFHLHSYQHDTSKNYNFRQEIIRGKQVFKEHFGENPIGYRAPQGNINLEEIRILEEEGFQFDSSIFPSYRPGIYNNLRKPREPYFPLQTEDLIEIPVGTTAIRIPLAQSYLKLLGRPYQEYLKIAPLPDPLIFNIHLQDIYQTASHDHLPLVKEFVFKRNIDASEDILANTITTMRKRGFRFGKISDIIESSSRNTVNLESDSYT